MFSRDMCDMIEKIRDVILLIIPKSIAVSRQTRILLNLKTPAMTLRIAGWLTTVISRALIMSLLRKTWKDTESIRKQRISCWEKIYLKSHSNVVAYGNPCRIAKQLNG